MRKLLYPASALTLVALVLGLWTYSRATGGLITICAKSDGDLYLIGPAFKKQACRRNETLISWNVQGPAGSPGPTGPASTTTALSVFDANNQNLGVLLDIDESRIRTFLPTPGASVEFLYFHNEAASSTTAAIGNYRAVAYADYDCNGEAFLVAPQAFTIYKTALGHVIATQHQVVPRLENSARAPDGTCTNRNPIIDGNHPRTSSFDSVSLPFTVPAVKPFHFAAP